MSESELPVRGRMHDDDEADVSPSTKLLAQGQASECASAVNSSSISPSSDHINRSNQDDTQEQNVFFTSTQWTADGTCLVSTSSNHKVSTFILPSDLLQQQDEPHSLRPQSTLTLPEPAQAILPSPYFSLTDPFTQTLLVGCRDHPLQIRHAFPNDSEPGGTGRAPLAIYKLIKHETEAYITPSSLLWNYPGTHFITGSMNRLDYFDVSRPGSEGPVLTIPTVPSKKHMSHGHGVGMKGQISALASTRPDEDSGQSIIAAGTRTRWIGLYDIHRTEKTIANWTVSGAKEDGIDIGQGIVQLAWSPCERYLVVNERHANSLLVYDIRGNGQLLCTLGDRKLASQQRLSCDVFAGDPYKGGFEVWAGTQDGSVLVWDQVGNSQGEVTASWSWKGHEAPVGSTALHSSGSVVATCSGGWAYPDHGMDTADSKGIKCGPVVSEESTLKVWSISAAS